MLLLDQPWIVAEPDALQAGVDALKELDALFSTILGCAFRGEL